MYLRETKRRNRDGSIVRYYQLAENEWDKQKGCAVAKVVYNFGRADALDREKLRRLAGSILRLFSGEEALAAEPDVRVLDAWPYGGVVVLEQLWHELEIDKVLGNGKPSERALFAMTANRALQPYSKLYCHEQWLKEEVFFPQGPELQLYQLYRAMDYLLVNQAQVEKAVYFKMADLMNADVDLIFYDTTNVHFEVDEEYEGGKKGPDGTMRGPLRKRGKAKNKRYDAPLVTVGLAVTREGLPVRSWVLPGNTTDVTTVERMKADLKGWKLGRCIFVGDAGMNSEENRRTLALGGGKYILAAKMRGGDEVTKNVMTRAGRYQVVRDNLRVKEQESKGQRARDRAYRSKKSAVCAAALPQTRHQARPEFKPVSRVVFPRRSGAAPGEAREQLHRSAARHRLRATDQRSADRSSWLPGSRTEQRWRHDEGGQPRAQSRRRSSVSCASCHTALPTKYTSTRSARRRRSGDLRRTPNSATYASRRARSSPPSAMIAGHSSTTASASPCA